MKSCKNLILPTFISLFSFFVISCTQPKDIKSFEAMNTFMTVQSYGKNASKANIAIQKRINQLENSFSTTKDTSYIYKLNNNAEKSVQTDDETYSLVKFALEMAENTDGALNIALFPVITAWGFTTGSYKVPSDEELTQLLPLTDYKKILLGQNNEISLDSGMKIDLGAIGKGFAGDEAIKILKEYGIESAILDLGGNVQALGTKPDGSDWMIGIKNPWGENGVIAGLKINDEAVITSGGYERFFTGEDGNTYIHIFDGKTGRPVENNIASVTIICHSGMYGDALSTTMFVLGQEKAFDFWKSRKDFEMIIITKDKQLFYTQELSDRLSFRYDFASITSVSP